VDLGEAVGGGFGGGDEEFGWRRRGRLGRRSYLVLDMNRKRGSEIEWGE